MKLAKVFKENKQFTLFSILALVVVGVAVFAPQIAPYDPLDAVMLESLQAPSSAHLFVIHVEAPFFFCVWRGLFLLYIIFIL